MGQFQRVLFARLLLQDAQLILLDEPFNGIDARTCADLLRVVQRWHGEGRTVIAVLHDMDWYASISRRRCCWRARRWPGARRHRCCAENLFRARQMAERWDESAPVCERA